MRARDRQASTERVQVEWERRHRLAGCERSRKRRVERDESAMDRQREKRGERRSERREAERRQRERMEAGSSQSQWNRSSAPLRDWGPRPDSKSEACDSPQAELEERFHSARFARCQESCPGSPTARVVLSPADGHEDDQAPVTASDDEEVLVNANAPNAGVAGRLAARGFFAARLCVYRAQHG